MQSVDVVVAGAGPAGSTTATLLARTGVRVLIVERGTFPRSKACSEYVSPGAGATLERMGVLADVEREATRLTGMRIVSPAGRSFVGRFTSDAGFVPFRPWGLALPRSRFDTILAEAARRAGATLYERSIVESFVATASGVTVRVRRGTTVHAVRAGLLVGADGLQSRIAAQMGVPRRSGARRVALVGHATGVRDMADVGEMHVGQQGYAGLAAVADGLTNVAVVVPTCGLPRAGSTLARLVEVLRRFPAVWSRLSAAQWHGPALAAGPFGRRTVRATGNAVTLVGDAADFFDPFTGEGIFAALRGAELLVPHVITALAAGRLHAADLAGYDRDRRRTFGGKWLLERAIGLVVAHPRLLDHVSARLARRPATADLLVGAAGDYVPAGRVLRPSVALRLVA